MGNKGTLNEDYFNKEYVCGFCRTEFNMNVRKFIGTSKKGRSNVSTQVKCPKCNNFVPTWS